MTNSDVYPYFVPASNAWQLPRWEISSEEDWIALPEWIEGWDPDTSLFLRSEIHADIAKIRSETFLASDAGLVLTISWKSSSSLMSGTALIVELVRDITHVEVELPADRIGGVISILTTISLGTESLHAAPGAAQFAGSMFLSYETRVAIEGTGAMFPVAIVDFAATPFDINSSWKLEASDELSAPFLGGFQLLLNARDAALVGAVASKKNDIQGALLIDQLESELAALMIEMSFKARRELESQVEWEPDTIGYVLMRFLRDARSLGITDSMHAEENTPAFRAKLGGVVRSMGFGRIFS